MFVCKICDKEYDDNMPEKLYQQCSVANIIKDLDLLNKKYLDTAMFGHFQ